MDPPYLHFAVCQGSSLDFFHLLFRLQNKERRGVQRGSRMFSFSSGLLKYSRSYMYVNLKLTKFSFDFAGLTEKSSFLYSGHKIRECERNAKEGKKTQAGHVTTWQRNFNSKEPWWNYVICQLSGNVFFSCSEVSESKQSGLKTEPFK